MLRTIFFITFITTILIIHSTEGCAGKGSSSTASSSSSSNSVANRGSFEDGNPNNFQGQGVSVSVQCDSSGKCTKTENTQTWG